MSSSSYFSNFSVLDCWLASIASSYHPRWTLSSSRSSLDNSSSELSLSFPRDSRSDSSLSDPVPTTLGHFVRMRHVLAPLHIVHAPIWFTAKQAGVSIVSHVLRWNDERGRKLGLLWAHTTNSRSHRFLFKSTCFQSSIWRWSGNILDIRNISFDC